MTYEMTVDAETSTSGRTAERLVPSSAAGNTPLTSHEAVPAFVPREQLYYWSYAWQESQRRAAANLAAGEWAEFDNPRDMVRWLLSDE